MVRRLICVIACIVLSLCLASQCFAMSANGQIAYNELLKGVDVDGYHINLRDIYLNQAENYLNANDLSNDKLDLALRQFDEFRGICQQQHVHTQDEMEKNQVCVDYCISAAETQGFTVVKTPYGYVLFEDGKQYLVDIYGDEVSEKLLDSTSDGDSDSVSGGASGVSYIVINKDDIVKTTGVDYMPVVYICIASCVFVGVAVVCFVKFRKKKREETK